ncbi:hypothetical protein HZ326_22041 [Fusarium oxysporum f. sp. albedinis]|nr:hypothetical protein HZ326_22041 [Fusarium oxysporum f. sp. albedinis]
MSHWYEYPMPRPECYYASLVIGFVISSRSRLLSAEPSRAARYKSVSSASHQPRNPQLTDLYMKTSLGRVQSSKLDSAE